MDKGEEDDDLKNDTVNPGNGEDCIDEHQDVVEKYKVPTKPKLPATSLQNDSHREKARSWRKKRILNKIKHTNGKEKGKAQRDMPHPRNVPKFRKEPIPMCRRAFPESFWKQPTTMQTSSLSSNEYSRFPPLFSSDNNNGEIDTRPLTPPGEGSPKESKKSMKSIVTPANTELLFSLFAQFENTADRHRIVRRGRPRKLPSVNRDLLHPRRKEDDPHMVDDLSEKLFPQLSLNGSSLTGIQKHAVIKLPRGGGQTVELPAVQLEKNFPVMLDQLSMQL